MSIQEKYKKLKELLKQIPVADPYESARLATKYRHLKEEIEREKKKTQDSS